MIVESEFKVKFSNLFLKHAVEDSDSKKINSDDNSIQNCLKTLYFGDFTNEDKRFYTEMKDLNKLKEV